MIRKDRVAPTAQPAIRRMFTQDLLPPADRLLAPLVAKVSFQSDSDIPSREAPAFKGENDTSEAAFTPLRVGTSINKT
jgi:hypothetical protein